MAIVESWYLKNIAPYSITINDIATPITLAPQTEIMNAIAGANTAEVLGASDIIRNYSRQGYLLSNYTHTHNDFSLTSHSHTGLNVLTTGPSSNASSLHTHTGFVSIADLEEEVDTRVDTAISDLDNVYVRKDGSINQLDDISSGGAAIENAVLKMHNEEHTLLEHIDDVQPFTISNFRKLFDGSNADCLHTHSGLGEGGDHNELEGLQGGGSNQYYHLSLTDYELLGDITSTAEEINQVTDGVGDSVTAANLTNLTDGSNADSLHSHVSYNIMLGDACNPSVGWGEGLFVWEEDTSVSCALGDVNGILGSLAPSPAPDLDNISIETNGVNGKLSFSENDPSGYYGVNGIGNLVAVGVDGVFSDSGGRAGIINASTNIDGVLNSTIPAGGGDPISAYDAMAFGDADIGYLILELNGQRFDGGSLTDRRIDLSNLLAQNTTVANSQSGLIVSASQATRFPNGNEFVYFQWRTGTFFVHSSEMRNGWNYVRVIHKIENVERETNYVDWVVDANTDNTIYDGMLFNNLIMSGSAYLSGVRYYTGGTANYSVTISNGQRNTYVATNAITFSGVNGTVPSLSFSATNGNEEQQTVITNRTFTISSGIRLLNTNISVRTNVNRTVQTDGNSGAYYSITKILMDSLIVGAIGQDDNSEGFRAEGYRLLSNLDITDINYGSGAGNGPASYVWDSTQNLITNNGYSDGLLQCNDRLRYPNKTSDTSVPNGDFRSVADGGSITYAYNGNPNYSTVNGERVYLRYFYDASARQNFNFVFSVNNTVFVAASNRGSLSGNNLTCEILAPNTTTNGDGTVEWKDMVTAYTSDSAIGAYSATKGASIPTNWGVTIGSKSTATSGKVIVIRITAPSSWVGYIESIECNFL